MSLWSHSADGAIDLRPHAGQWAALASTARVVAIFAGTQGGKTSFLPWWLLDEIGRSADPAGGNDYLAITATYDLFKLKFLPALREVFEHATRSGRYWSGDRVIELADPATGRFWATRADDAMWGRIILRSAESGGGLESTSARAAIFDEAGQDGVTIDTYEALRRRLTLAQGRLCLGTTLYNLGWLKTAIYDPWIAARGAHPEIDVIQFDSLANPAFPAAEYAAARARLAAWEFDMFYRGRFARPAGLIYDAFIAARHVVPAFAIPAHWPRYAGLDFGGVNTAALIVAEELGPSTADGTLGDPTGRLFVTREYKAGGRTSAEHATAIIADEPMIPLCVGGSGSEGQWRREFRSGGLPVREPDILSVDLGISRVYGAFKTHELYVFDTCTGLIAELGSYRRVIDSQGQPTEAIEAKSTYHLLDALRYIIGWFKRTSRVGVR